VCAGLHLEFARADAWLDRMAQEGRLDVELDENEGLVFYRVRGLSPLPTSLQFRPPQAVQAAPSRGRKSAVAAVVFALLVPGAGPWVLLGSVVTDAGLPPTAEMRRSCGTCTACLPACPTGAIVAPGVLDARRCLSAALQTPGWIAVELREAVGDRLYGCDDCLEACPPGDRLLAGAATPGGRVDVYAMLSSDDATLRAAVAHFYVPHNEGRWLRRNALVVLGNTGGPDAVGVLSGYAAHRDPVLRGHAAWALGRIGDARSRAVLRRVVGGDADGRVAAEAMAALEGTLAR
jgi:epoxyqueuosine reductase